MYYSKHIILSKELELFYSKLYPFISKKKSKKRYEVTIGVGGNIGNSIKRFEKLFFHLKRNSLLDILQTSPIIKNPPFGFLNQESFYNGLIVVKTNLSPKEFLSLLLKIEKRFYRKRKFKNAPRTLDLDIIFFDKTEYNSKTLQIPHPHYQDRLSVMIPLILLS